MEIPTEQIEELKKKICEALKIDVNELDGNKSFKDYGADSLDMLEIVFEAEGIFNTTINEEDARSISCFKDIVSYINEKAEEIEKEKEEKKQE